MTLKTNIFVVVEIIFESMLNVYNNYLIFQHDNYRGVVKMFYDNFTKDQICGIFTTGHFVAIIVFIVLAVLVIVLSKKLTVEKTKKLLLAIAICVTIMEIVKIAIRIYKGDAPRSWIPLYYCSLFIFAIWCACSKNTFFQNLGYSFMVFGGIVAAIVFTIYPSTSLMIFPIWHPGSIHSLIYHWLMFYSGVLVLMKSLYKPQPKHAVHYFIFVSIACVAAVVVNHFLGTNMMLLRNPIRVEILDKIYNASHGLYIFLAYIAQSVLIYWTSYAIYFFAIKICNKKIKIHKSVE